MFRINGWNWSTFSSGWEISPARSLAINLEQAHCNVPLARGLYEQGTENSYIPQDLIGPVAEVLRWVQSLQRQ